MLRYVREHQLAQTSEEEGLVAQSREAFFDEDHNCVMCGCHGPEMIRVDGIVRNTHTLVHSIINGKRTIAYLGCFKCRSDKEFSVCWKHPKVEED